VDGQGGATGIELTTVSYRLRPEWVREYLAAPARFGVAPTTMPSQFFQLAADGKSFRETMPRAAERVGRVTDALFSLNAARREGLEKTYANAKAAYPHADAALGEQLFRSLNCAACHRHPAISPRLEPAAPELGGEGLRVNKAWLEGFLKHPQPVRPFGYRPGDGSRMPDFRLADDEVAALSAVLNAWRSGQPLATNYQPHPLSAFAKQKAKLLLAEKLSCLGCHQLDGQGGRIGPDLSAASVRLQPDYVYVVIANPRAVAPHSAMPQVPMSEETSRLLADYLLEHTAASSNTKYLSAVDHDLIPLSPGDGAVVGGSPEVRRTYLNYCAACHGGSGRGDGYNARYLSVKPTAHADAKYLSTRPDDTLFDGIHSGGYVLNKSRLMPPWGQTLSPKQIRELVGYLRTLCQCQGPAWSRDNARLP
jgi:mono/diheme cytochrome c family protein